MHSVTAVLVATALMIASVANAEASCRRDRQLTLSDEITKDPIQFKGFWWIMVSRKGERVALVAGAGHVPADCAKGRTFTASGCIGGKVAGNATEDHVLAVSRIVCQPR